MANKEIYDVDGKLFNVVESGIVGYKPLRGKKSLKNKGVLPANVDGLKKVAKNTFTSNKGIVRRDSYDVISCDAVLVNLLGAQRVSIGTVAEIAWAWLLRKPLVLVMEESGNIHEHGFILEMCDYMVGTLDEGIAQIKGILLAD